MCVNTCWFLSTGFVLSLVCHYPSLSSSKTFSEIESLFSSNSSSLISSYLSMAPYMSDVRIHRCYETCDLTRPWLALSKVLCCRDFRMISLNPWGVVFWYIDLVIKLMCFSSFVIFIIVLEMSYQSRSCNSIKKPKNLRAFLILRYLQLSKDHF